MDLNGKVAVITGGVSGIGRSVCQQLAHEQVKAVAVVDMNDDTTSICKEINNKADRELLYPYRGDVTDSSFRESVFEDMESRFGVVSLCVPAAGIVKDRLMVKIEKGEGSPRISMYSEETFRRVMEVDLVAPIYWAMRTVASIALDRAKRGLKQWQPEELVQGAIVLIGSVSSAGNKGQISYASAKAGLEGAQSTLGMEAIHHGVRCAIIHPGYTDTPMVRALGEDLIRDHILPRTQLRRLIRPDEIAGAIVFMLKNSSVSGSLWADAGWHPAA